MKRLFFAFVMMSSTALLALPIEHSLSHQDLLGKQMSEQQEAAMSASIRQKNTLKFLSELQCCKKRHRPKNRCCRGFEGLAGPQGAAGPVGPAGLPATLINAYGSAYSTQLGGSFLFTGLTPASENVALAVFGLILEEPGDYLVIFGASSSTASPPGTERVQLQLDFSPIPGSILNLTENNQMTTKSTIVHVTFVAGFDFAFLTLANLTGVTPGTNNPGDITAFITAKRLHDINTP